MDSHLWGVLAHRVGCECFLRHALPVLLAWLEGVVDSSVFGDVSWTREEGDAANESVERARSSSSEGGVLSAGEAGGVVAAAATEADLASSRVQAAAAASVSGEVYECLGENTARTDDGGEQNGQHTVFRADHAHYGMEEVVCSTCLWYCDMFLVSLCRW